MRPISVSAPVIQAPRVAHLSSFHEWHTHLKISCVTTGFHSEPFELNEEKQKKQTDNYTILKMIGKLELISAPTSIKDQLSPWIQSICTNLHTIIDICPLKGPYLFFHQESGTIVYEIGGSI